MSELLQTTPELSRALNHVKTQRALLVADWQKEIRSIQEQGELTLYPEALTSTGFLLNRTCEDVTKYLAWQVLVKHGSIKPFRLSTSNHVCNGVGHTVLGIKDPITGLVAAYDATPQQVANQHYDKDLDVDLEFGPFNSEFELAFQLGKVYLFTDSTKKQKRSSWRWETTDMRFPQQNTTQELWDKIIEAIRANVIDKDSLLKAREWY